MQKTAGAIESDLETCAMQELGLLWRRKTAMTRTESDSMGTDRTVPADACGARRPSARAATSAIGGQRFPRALIRALGVVKKCAALANIELGELDVLTKARAGGAPRRPPTR